MSERYGYFAYAARGDPFWLVNFHHREERLLNVSTASSSAAASLWWLMRQTKYGDNIKSR